MSLIAIVNDLRKTGVEEVIAQRASEFLAMNKRESPEWFLELCFCIMTANFNAERAMGIQESIGKGFLTMDERELAGALKALGHRFPSSRARYIARARAYSHTIKEILEPLSRDDKRDWLVDNIYGFGYKEASHFLRNTGHFDYAIIDFHILDLLEREAIIKKPESMSKKTYLAIEKNLTDMAEKLSMPSGLLDLYLWFLETGKVLK
jgi:N-glycosylase/DNA lyase